TSRSVSTLAGRPFSNVRSATAIFFAVLLTLTGSSYFVTEFFGRSPSRTYDEEKPVEDRARRADAILLSTKPRRNDFHTHSGNHFIAIMFWKLLLGGVLGS